MSILLGGESKSEKWATIVSFIVFGAVIAYILGYIVSTVSYGYAAAINATSYARQIFAQTFNETVTTAVVTVGNYTAVVAQPANSPFTSVTNVLMWILSSLGYLVSQPMFWAAVIAVTLIVIAVVMR